MTNLSFGDSVGGADLCAAAAADALIGIDVIDVAGSDSSYRANGLAGSTSHAVVANYVCHSSLVFKIVIRVVRLVVFVSANLGLYFHTAKKLS